MKKIKFLPIFNSHIIAKIWVFLSILIMSIVVSAAESVVIPVPNYRPPETVQRVAVPVVPSEHKYNVLIVTGENSYEHDWTGINNRLRTQMLDTGVFDVRVVEDFSTATLAMLKQYDALFINYLGLWNYTDKQEKRWGKIAEKALFDYVKQGGGVVLYHASFSMGSAGSWSEFERMAGGTMRPYHGSRRSPVDAFRVHIVDNQHPVTRGMREYVWTMMDDMYTNMYWHPEAKIHVLAAAYDNAENYDQKLAGPKYPPHLYTKEKLAAMENMNTENPQVWTVEYGKGRVFCISLGHGPDTLTYDGVKSLILRGTEWAASGNVTIPIGDKAKAFQ